jgi:hypothetical protein
MRRGHLDSDERITVRSYFRGAYPILFAAGAVAFERLRPRRWLAWIRPAYIVSLALVGALLAYLWGPGAESGRVIILVGYSESFARTDASASFTNVALAATLDSPYCSSYERNLRIYVLSGVKDPSFDLRKHWPSLKHFD